MAGRLLGIDHGLARIGVAVSDALQITARELTVITRTTNAADTARLRALIREYAPVALVVGLPNADDGEPEQAKLVTNWTERLTRTVPLPVVYWDEQMSSHEAAELARDLGRRPRDPVDDLAARVILQSYLDALAAGLAAPPPTA